MKKAVFSSVLITLCIVTLAQAPEYFNYQAIVRDASYNPITDQAVSFRISILKGGVSGSEEYIETHNTSTNGIGLVTLAIGNGSVESGDFTAIDWGSDSFFLKVEIDPEGGTNYTEMGITQILSVPYALYASNANNIRLVNNSRLSDLYVADNGSLWIIPQITVEKPYSELPTVTDADGNIYGTVKIGTQVWLSENLKTTKYNDDSPIQLVSDSIEWMGMEAPAYCWYKNDISNKELYGALYNWYAVTTGILCPDGWHVPSFDEWTILKNYMGSLGGGRLKESGTEHWISNNNGINDSEFTALPGGHRDWDGGFRDFGQAGIWWTSNAYNSNTGYYLGLHSVSVNVIGPQYNLSFAGASIRCIKDE